MDNLVSFKVYLCKYNNNDKAEVRRLGIEHDVATSYSYLVEKLKSIFPSLQDSRYPFHLYWKDSDNDEVVIRTDAELIIALTELEDSIKKIYVKVDSHRDQAEASAFQANQTPCSNRSNSVQDLHEGVVCDGCNGRVVGFRYKCVQCPDFDLCSTCEVKRLHSNHLMLRIPSPINRISGVKVCSCSGKTKGKCCDGSGQEFNVPAEYPGFCPFSKRHGKKYWKRHGYKGLGDIKHGKSVMQSLIDSALYFANVDPQSQQNCAGATYHNLAQESAAEQKCKHATDEQQSDATCDKKPHNQECKDQAPSNSSKPKSASTSESAKQESAECRNENIDFIGELINTFAPIITSSLQKQGPIFDFINEVISDATAANSNTAEKSTDNATKSGAQNNANNKETVVNNNTPRNIKEENSVNPNNGNEKANAVFTIVSDNGAGPSGLRQITIATPDMDKLVKDLEKLATNNDQHPVEKSPDISTASAPPKEDLDSQSSSIADAEMIGDGIRVKAVDVEQKEEDGWTLLTNQQSTKPVSDTVNVGNNTGAIPKVFPKTADNPPQPSTNSNTTDTMHRDYPEHVCNGLRRMLAMGFSNEGNWLGDLLMKNNGDVAAVIDLLLPAKQKAF